MPDPRKHAERRTKLEEILRELPGFRGYLEKEYRRESDYLARSWLADRLAEAKRSLDEYGRRLVDQGQLDDLPSFERLNKRLDQLASTIRGDVRGYSGFFDYVRIDEAVLEDVYAHDMDLMQQVRALLEEVHRGRELEKPARELAGELEQRVNDLQGQYRRRRELLEGLAD